MCKIVHVAVEIVNTCIDKHISIDYFKVQKLAYLCQCRHLFKYHVPLAPEQVWNWSCGAGFKEIYRFFNELNLTSGNITNRINKETHLLFFEKETVNEVLSQYGEKDFTSLTHLTKSDPVFSEIPIGSEVPINKITKYFYQNR